MCKVVIRIFCLIYALCLCTCYSFAEDYLILVDNSGSMLETDPANLRFEGLRLFGNFIRKEDSLKVVTLDGKVISDHPQFEIGKYINDIDNYRIEYSEYTDLFSQLNVLNEKKIVILISDGKMEPRPTEGRSLKDESKHKIDVLLNQVLPRLKEMGVAINTICFSDKADKDFLKKVSSFTGGVSWYSSNIRDLNRIFSELVLNVSNQQQVPIRKEGVMIDDSVDEATFYLERKDGKVQVFNPDNQLVIDNQDDVRWYLGEGFDVITIMKPLPGKWAISGVGFAAVLTSLKLKIEWPKDIRVGDEVKFQARLFEYEKPVSLADISGVLKVAFQFESQDKISLPQIQGVMLDDGESPDTQSADGEFAGMVKFDESGNYKLRVIAKSPTFEREQSRIFEVKEPWLKIEEDGENINVSVHEDARAYKELTVKLTFEGENKTSTVEAKRLNPLHYAVAKSDAISWNGEYKVTASLEVRKRDELVLEVESESISIKIDGYEGSPVIEKIIKIKDEEDSKKEEVVNDNYIFGGILIFLLCLTVPTGFWFKYSKREKKSEEVSIPEIPEAFLDFEQSLQILLAIGEDQEDDSPEEISSSGGNSADIDDERAQSEKLITELFTRGDSVAETEEDFEEEQKDSQS